MPNIYKDLEAIKLAALHYAEEHKKNYNIIIHNPVNGAFDMESSTYEFVADSYFEKPRENVIRLYTTDELLSKDSECSTPPCPTAPICEETIMPTRGAGSLHRIGLASYGRIPHGHGEPDVILADGTLKDINTIGTKFPVRVENHYEKSFNSFTPFKREHKKVQNNEPCYCGSGKKFKNCHKNIAP